MNPQSRSGALQERGSGNPSAPDPTNDPRGDARYAWADGDAVFLDVELEPLLTNLVDVLAEHPALLRHLNGAVFASVQYEVVSSPTGSELAARFRDSRVRERADHVTALATSDDVRDCLTHVLTEDQATDLALELDHAIRQIAVAEYNPHAIERVDLEDQWTEPVP